VPVYLTLAFCLLAQPDFCRDIRPDMVDDFPLIGIAACQAVGERIGAEWVDAHPQRRLDRVKCRIGVAPREQEL
jgi:hypothetical protein